MPSQRITPALAKKLLEQYHLSGLTRTAFLEKHSVSLSLFAYWQPLLQNSTVTKKPSFQELSIPPSLHGPCTLTLPSGIRLEFPTIELMAAITVLTAAKA